ncbi:3',5'-cyclic AMP phosphodiesterase CpdA [Cryobacterium psychrotolerans]|uniref:3',5'-cyclic AMP phosphodiesterase CpdA n=1 Tax=Cryobacterium psychrotolerans TaxID=386301 RepID=A0A1G9HGX6_9MICO|nr:MULTISPECIES: phosphodiesterase [Cryobacterium]TFD46820.1 phosphodiesterase [Cryobacterium sp. TMT1-2-1]TFD90831.1 phosphodiesterase [Cryobacterium psychrotolerans]SDL12155.1 3',5'-cyclic AMP phosphodiesterase CpdA [Cryobacterium psychrotolerans]
MPDEDWGQYSPASHLLVHLSDTHFLGAERPLFGAVDTDSTVQRALEQLERSGLRPDAIVLTGDIADRGEPDAYRRVRDLVEAAADRLGTQVIWVMGNHDERAAFRTELLREEESANTGPVDAVFDIRGLRVIVLDTSVPGYHHGEVSDEQLAWLAGVLADPAPHGSLLALHHPPVPTPTALMSILELRDQPRLAEVIAGSDIRSILGGHMHSATTGQFAGIPVSVAAATCYTLDPSAPRRELSGVDGGQSFNLVRVYEDQVVHSHVPLGAYDVVTHFDAAFLDRFASLTAEERTEAFSRHA